MLTYDVLRIVLDDLDITALCSCTKVSRLWRLCAEDHPTYWRKLSLGRGGDLSASALSFFLRRLDSRRDPQYTISVSVRWIRPQPGAQVALLVPALMRHFYRLEELDVVLSHSFVGAMTPLFTCDAPRLRNLRLEIQHGDRHVPAVSAMFNVHAHSALERVSLRDVVLPPNLPPVSHTLKAIKVDYTRQPSETQINRLLSWIPRSESVDICPRQALVLHAASDAKPCIPATVIRNMPALRHLVVYHEDILRQLIDLHIPALNVRLARLNGALARKLLPRTGRLCLRMSTRVHPDTYEQLGCIIVSTPDRSIVRQFDYLSVPFMTARSFAEAMFQADRLSLLAITLSPCFRKICAYGFAFPQLVKLQLSVDSLPNGCGKWRWGRVECPRLATLALQRESPGADVSISRFDLDAFVATSLVLDTDAALRVILMDVGMSGDDSPGGWIREILRPLSSTSWLDDGPEKRDGSVASSDTFTSPKHDWLDG